MPPPIVFRGQLVLPDHIVTGAMLVRDGRIVEILDLAAVVPDDAVIVDAGDGYLSPGFVDLHVHGGLGGDFMDGTTEAFQNALTAHVRHGTTRMAITTTVARHEQILATLQLARQFRKSPYPAGARVLGAHFYGPYFRYEAKGAHPGAAIRPAISEEFEQYLEFADDLVTATVAPEIEGAKEFALACRERGVRTNVGHSWATFAQMEEAVDWGVRHVDHLFCAMSDKTRLRQFQMYPMQGGVLEATLFFDDLTTEVIADGKHLDSGLLKLALKIKGSDKLALVTDCSRALDMPDGNYMIGPLDGGEPLMKKNGVGQMPDGLGLASSVEGMDHMLRTFIEYTGCPLWEAVKMASLTPARIAGRDAELGSLERDKVADVVVFDRDLNVKRVFIDGGEIKLY
ncbi:MAG: N-acetylglucosamine-6-phosphate deacetylase [Planctomycetota bacterium]|nr:N-acetylglucosamine-6-phosphate deacetylase [Planctomycetota bacterium]MDA1211926.1 N-acetylglucosamine-6-phosphate deacetylase [Planctomycetota bacterium]